MGPDKVWVNCPHCDDFEIWDKEDKRSLFYCKNPDCRKGTWLVCKGTFKYPRDACNMTPEEEKDMVSKDGVNSHIYWIDYIDQVQEIIQILEKEDKRYCPKWGYNGRKDSAWTHITCNKWSQVFCYVWGIANEKLNKEDPKGSISSHNVTTIYNLINLHFYKLKIKFELLNWIK